ncbi:hypothetical protein FBT69_06085 [Synechococcales cyanobacterium CNB]|nr:hypothetical protein [Phycisphaerales bacterium]MDL1904373.1 hypothetical protein [Synechococcales cyanobacterium CNB]
MASTESFQHVFRYHNRTIRLLGHIEERLDHKQLVLDDVLATTLQIANDVPDERIEAEASKAAHDRGAVYR